MKLILKEAALKHPEPAVKSIVGKIVAIGKGYSNEGDWFEQIPFSEILYLNNPVIKTGLPMFYHGHVLERDAAELAAYNYEWNRDKKEWNPEFVQEFMDKSYSLYCAIDTNLDARGLSTIVRLEDGKQRAAIFINPLEIDRSQFFMDCAEVVRHELQHFVQTVNGLCLAYGQQLKTLNGNFSDLKHLPFTLKRDFGQGQKRYQTGLRQGLALTKKGSDEEMDKYFSDDAEFETWLSDFVEKYATFLIYNGYLRKDILVRKKDNLNAVANEFTKLFFEDANARDEFFQSTGFPQTFLTSYESLMRNRKREFMTDFRSNLEEFLNLIVQKIGPYKKPEKEEQF